MNNLYHLFDLTIDFKQSHLFFPKLISFLLLCFLILILIVNRNGIKEKLIGLFNARHDEYVDKVNKKKMFLSVLLLCAYFFIMPYVGDISPNSGYGFLITTMPFIFLLSLIYIPELKKKELVIITINSLVSPISIWFLMGHVFGISLP